MSQCIFSSFTISNSNLLKFQNIKVLRCENTKNIGTQTFHFQNFRFTDIKKKFPRMFPYLYVFFDGERYGVRGSRFGHIFGRFKNIPKTIAIDQESLIMLFLNN